MVAHDPLHRSGRAALPHPALALGENAKANKRIGMTDASGRKPPGEVVLHPAPREAVGLAAAQKHPMPQPTHGPAEEADGPTIHRHAEVPEVTANDRAHIGPLLRDGEMHAPPSDRLPQHRKPSPPRLPTDVGEAQEVECCRLTLTPPPPVAGREGAELDEARLVRVQREAELGEPLPKRG